MEAAAAAPPAAAGESGYKGWRAIPIQHQELDPSFQVVPQSSVASYLGESGASQPERRGAAPQPRTLDGDMLLDACNENFPGDVYSATLSGRGIDAIATEDAPFFLSLSRLDLSDNRCARPPPARPASPPRALSPSRARARVPFDQLAAFPALRDVTLQCNGLRHLAYPGGFAVLEVRSARAPPALRAPPRGADPPARRAQVLDLSVNAIGAEGIGALSQLPCLKELDISRCASALPRPLQPPGPARAHARRRHRGVAQQRPDDAAAHGERVRQAHQARGLG